MDEIAPGHYTAEYWEYDSRLGRRWNQDPKPNPSISAPVVAGLGEGLSLFSDVINTALDFKNKDVIDASINTGIRLVSFGVGKYFDKSLEGVQSQLPKSLGDETIGEKVLKLGVD